MFENLLIYVSFTFFYRINILYKTLFVYCRELAPDTDSLTSTQGDDSKQKSNCTVICLLNKHIISIFLLGFFNEVWLTILTL